MEVKGSAAIITGSATGVGAATALLLASKGCKVVINYSKSEEEAKETLAQCEALGVETLLFKADVSKDDECRAMVAAAFDKWGRIDVLVNNAGISSFGKKDLVTLDADDFQRIYAVNVIGPYQMAQAVAPHMQEAGRGTIVNVSSVAGIMGIGSSMAYSASKGALNTLTLGLARKLAPQIRVNAVCPGFIATRWFRDGLGDDGYERVKSNMEKNTPLQSASSAEDIAGAVVWMVEGGDHVTGELMVIDSGLHLGYAPPLEK